MLRGEMTRHVLKCYPRRHGTPDEPVGNELSMLIFYLHTRPAKIKKAAAMLAHRGAKCVGNANTFMVTLRIIEAFVEELADHFTLFAEVVLELLGDALGHGYLRPGCLLFKKFNGVHRGVLFTGHPEYTKKFKAVVDKVSHIAQGSGDDKKLALEALGSLAASPALATPVGQQTWPVALDAILGNLPKEGSGSAKIDGGNPNADAIRSLAAFLKTNHAEQIKNVTMVVMRWAAANNGLWLIRALPSWAPPPLRFLVVQAGVYLIYEAKVEEVKAGITYAGYLEALLTEATQAGSGASHENGQSSIPTNMEDNIDAIASASTPSEAAAAGLRLTGLDVLDVLRKLVKIQHNLIVSPPEGVAPGDIQELILRTRRNVGHLARTQTYADQAGDMVSELLRAFQRGPKPRLRLRQASTLSTRSMASSPSASPSTTAPLGILVNDLLDLREVLSSNSVLSVDLWEGTQWVLTSGSSQLLVLYCSTFAKFLAHCRPPVDLFFEQGVIIQQLVAVLDAELPPMNYVAVYYASLLYLQFQKQKAVLSLPYIYELIGNGGSGSRAASRPASISSGVSSHTSNMMIGMTDTADSTAGSTAVASAASTGGPSSIHRSSVGLTLFLAAFDLNGRLEVAANVTKLITRRVERQRWLPYVTYPPIMDADKAVQRIVAHGNVIYGDSVAESIDLSGLGLGREEKTAIVSPNRSDTASIDDAVGSVAGTVPGSPAASNSAASNSVAGNSVTGNSLSRRRRGGGGAARSASAYTREMHAAKIQQSEFAGFLGGLEFNGVKGTISVSDK